MKGYKLFIIGLLLGAIVGAVVSPCIAAATASNVGVIDLEKAVTSHPGYDAKMDTFDAYKKSENARLDVYRNKSTLTDAEKSTVVNLRVEIDNNIAAKYDELFNPLEDDVLAAVKKVGMESGIEVILDVNAVLYGGLDLTPAVISTLKSK